MSKINPLVTVVMPVYNCEQFVTEAVNSILSQTYTNFEYIIIDDGSSDKTSTILSRFSDPRIRVIKQEVNQGIVHALNQGIRASKGIYIARMDADDLSLTSRLEKQVQFLETHKEYAAVGTFTQVINGSGSNLYSVEQPTRDLAIKKHLLHDSCLAHGSVMFRRKPLIEIGLYSENSGARHAEDYDLFARLAAKYKLANIPEYLYQYREHVRSVSAVYSQQQLKSVEYIRKTSARLIPKLSAPQFSVLMPTYNKGEYIEEAIDSVRAQLRKDWELIIIDDGSTDNTEKIMTKYATDKRIIYLKNPLNLGRAKTRNRLIKESVAPIIGELDSDDVLAPDALEIMYKAHKTKPLCGFIYSQFEYCDEELANCHKGFCRAAKTGETNLHAHFASAFRTYKRGSIEGTSGFDVSLYGAEDLDMIYKIEEVAPIHFIDKVLYRYRMTPGRSKLVNWPGTISHIKAKLAAYRRRKKSGYLNISLFTLLRQCVNLIYTSVI